MTPHLGLTTSVHQRLLTLTPAARLVHRVLDEHQPG
jgi:hypothetical protein